MICRGSRPYRTGSGVASLKFCTVSHIRRRPRRAAFATGRIPKGNATRRNDKASRVPPYPAKE